MGSRGAPNKTRYADYRAFDPRGNREIIGISRETATRTFTEFKGRRLIELKGSSLTFPDRAALEDVATA